MSNRFCITRHRKSASETTRCCVRATQGLLVVALLSMPSVGWASQLSIYTVISGSNVSGTTVLATGSTQRITVRLMATGTQSPPYDAKGFETVVTVSGSNGGLASQMAYAAGSIVGGGANFLFPSGNGSANVDSGTQTYVAVDSSSATTLSGLSSPTPILEFDYILAASATQGSSFTFSLLSDPTSSYGFSPAAGIGDYAGFTPIATTIVVVPEPTMPAVFVVFGLMAVGYRARGRFRATKGAAAA
ncbi:MAG: hypothetical protein WCO99_01950 [Planctomycetota bacterium]